MALSDQLLSQVSDAEWDVFNQYMDQAFARGERSMQQAAGRRGFKEGEGPFGRLLEQYTADATAERQRQATQLAIQMALRNQTIQQQREQQEWQEKMMNQAGGDQRAQQLYGMLNQPFEYGRPKPKPDFGQKPQQQQPQQQKPSYSGIFNDVWFNPNSAQPQQMAYQHPSYEGIFDNVFLEPYSYMMDGGTMFQTPSTQVNFGY